MKRNVITSITALMCSAGVGAVEGIGQDELLKCAGALQYQYDSTKRSTYPDVEALEMSVYLIRFGSLNSMVTADEANKLVTYGYVISDKSKESRQHIDDCKRHAKSFGHGKSWFSK